MITRATIVHARHLPTPDGTSNMTGAQTSPWAQTPSRPKQNSPSGANSASPESGLGYLLPCESHRWPYLQTVVHVSESKDGLGCDLGWTSASPKPGSDLDISDGGRPNVTSYNRADAPLKKLFPCLALFQPLRYRQPLASGARARDRALGFGLGSQQEPSRHKSTTKYKTKPPGIPSKGYEDISSKYAANSRPPGSSPLSL
jgi:hypothetical protein